MGNGCSAIPTPLSTLLLGSAYERRMLVTIASWVIKGASNCVSYEPSHGIMFMNDEQENMRQEMVM